MPHRSGGAYRPLFSALSLGNLGHLRAAVGLTCGRADSNFEWRPTRSPVSPVASRRIWHATGTARLKEEQDEVTKPEGTEEPPPPATVSAEDDEQPPTAP